MYIGPKKLPVVPVTYREKVRAGRSEIILFKTIFHAFSGSVSTRFNNYCDNTRHNGTPLYQPRTSRRKYGCVFNHVQKIIGSAEKNRVGRGTGTTSIFTTVACTRIVQYNVITRCACITYFSVIDIKL